MDPDGHVTKPGDILHGLGEDAARVEWMEAGMPPASHKAQGSLTTENDAAPDVSKAKVRTWVSRSQASAYPVHEGFCLQ